MMPLALCNIGEINTIKQITGKLEVRKHLEDMGFVAGAEISIVSIINGNVIVKLKDSRVAISEELSRRIMV